MVSDAPSAVPEVTLFQQGTLASPCVNGVFKHIKEQYCPFGEDLLQACHTHFHTSQVSDGPQATENQGRNAMSQFQQVQSRPAGACVACGCGDNTIGHWTRWCIIPFVVVWIILQPSSSLQSRNNRGASPTSPNAAPVKQNDSHD